MTTYRFLQRVLRVFIVASFATLGACSTMKATDSGYLSQRNNLAFTEDGGAGRYRAQEPIDTHQIRNTTVEWVAKGSSDLSAPEKDQLLGTLRDELSSQLGALPAVSSGKAVILRAAITRAEVVSPTLNAVSTLLLFAPLDRGGAAVEMELLDAQTRLPLASLSTAYYPPLSEFKARFSRLSPANLALKNAVTEFAKLVQTSVPNQP